MLGILDRIRRPNNNPASCMELCLCLQQLGLCLVVCDEKGFSLLLPMFMFLGATLIVIFGLFTLIALTLMINHALRHRWLEFCKHQCHEL